MTTVGNEGLLNAIEVRMSELGCPRAVPRVLLDNAPAVGLYKSTGWRPTEPYAHALHGRPARNYVRAVPGTFPTGGHIGAAPGAAPQ